MKKIGHFINGEEVFDGTKTINLFNPNNGEKIGIVSIASDEIIDNAINSSIKAYNQWQNLSIAKRSSILFRYKVLLENNIEKVAELVSLDLGKVKDDAIGEIRRGIENVEYSCAVGEILKGEFNKNVSTEIDSWSEFQPIGVVLGITPFNFPVMVPLWMFPLALSAGNSFILKPSEQVPLATMYIAQLFNQTGAPKGLLNVINGDSAVAENLVKNKEIKAVSFVGSTPIAKKVYENSTLSGKRCQALGGAKNHALVMPDADIDYTTNQLISAAYGSSGQRCMALSVAMVTSEVKNEFISSLTEKVASLKVGLDILESNNFGPLVSENHKEKVQNYISLAEKEGSNILLDGRDVSKGKNSSNGYHIGPTIIDNVSTSMKSYQNEIFGPVLQIIEIKDFDEGVSIINKNRFGNGCCIFTSGGEKSRSFYSKVDIGMVGINIPLPVPSSFHSFGGWKDSIFGDLNIYGPDGLRFYTKRKTITQRWPASSNSSSKINLSMPNNLT